MAAELWAAAGRGPDGHGESQFNLFAIIDASRDPTMIPAALEGMTDHCTCLYQGKAREDYGDYAPWLVELRPDEGVLDWVMEEVYGRRRCLFFSSSRSLEQNATHFRKFIKIRNAEGELIFFRFFDPLIFTAFVDVFSKEQREAFFEGIEAIVAEFSRFILTTNRLDAEGGIVRRVTVAPGENPADNQQPDPREAVIALPTTDLTGTAARPFFAFSKEQLEAPYQRNRVLMIDSIVNYLHELFPDSKDQFTLPHMQMMAEAAIIQAAKYNIVTEAEVCAFAALMWRYAPNFDDVPALRNVLERDIPAEEKIEKLYTGVPERQWAAATRNRDEERWVGIIEQSAARGA